MCMMGRPMSATRNSDGTQMYLPAGVATLSLMQDKKGVADFRQRHGDNTEAYAAMFGYDENVTKTLAKTEGREWDRYDPFGLKKPPTEAELKGTVSVTEPTSTNTNPAAAAVQNTGEAAKNAGPSKLRMPQRKSSSPIKPIKQAATGTSLSGAGGLNVPT